MTSVIGMDGNIHYVYNTENADIVAELLQKLGIFGLEGLTGTDLKQINTVLIPSESDAIKLLDGIIIMTKEGPRKVFVALQEI